MWHVAGLVRTYIYICGTGQMQQAGRSGVQHCFRRLIVRGKCQEQEDRHVKRLEGFESRMHAVL